MKHVIVGGGPAGLYTAKMLYKKGVRDLVIYDSRGGRYTRPGHLSHDAYIHGIQKMDRTTYDRQKTYHIKDLERALFKEIQALGITVEKKHFVRMHQDEQEHGIVVCDELTGIEETVLAEYVFDCTGNQRTVVSAVNAIVPEAPFQLTEIIDVPVKNHFIAYVKMDPIQYRQFETASSNSDTSDAESFTKSILKLRALGWMEYKFPRCYGARFGKDKVCLYLHAPSGLSEEKYDEWVQTVLECYTKPIRYTHVKKSKTYDNKPTFLAFTTHAQALSQTYYQRSDLPTVVALGDAQIDCDYFLADGIYDGMQRIDCLMPYIEVSKEGEITFFDSNGYLEDVTYLLQLHKQRLMNSAISLKQSFIHSFESARLIIWRASRLPSFQEQKPLLQQMLQELNARSAYHAAKAKIEGMNNKMLSRTNTLLYNIHDDLMKASNLPASFTKEVEDVNHLLITLAHEWGKAGNEAYKKKQYDDAIAAYKKSLDIYHLTIFEEKYEQEELLLYSNLAVVYNASHLFSEALAAGNIALEFSVKYTDIMPNLQGKIMSILITALHLNTQNDEYNLIDFNRESQMDGSEENSDVSQDELSPINILSFEENFVDYLLHQETNVDAKSIKGRKINSDGESTKSIGLFATAFSSKSVKSAKNKRADSSLRSCVIM